MVRPLLAGAGIAGGLAAANRALREAPLATNALGGTRRPWTWRGYEIFATEAGDGPLVLLVHGISAGGSSYEYRRLFPLLARAHRVIAFDALGCGLSEKPDLRYTAELFVEQIVDALGLFADGPATLVGSSLGGAYAIRAATRAPDAVEAVAAICPPLDAPSAPRTPLAALLRSPLLGEALFNAAAARPVLRRVLERRVYADSVRVTPEMVEHYYALTHAPGARYVPAALAGGRLACDVASDLPFLTVPLLLVCGIAAAAGAEEALRLARGARLTTFVQSALLPHDEEPEAVAAALEAFFAVEAG